MHSLGVRYYDGQQVIDLLDVLLDVLVHRILVVHGCDRACAQLL